MNVHDDIPLEWAIIDGEGLVRVYNTQSFRQGFEMVTLIGGVAEQIGYFPEVQLSTQKLIVTVPEDGEGLDHQLVHAIDATLRDEA